MRRVVLVTVAGWFMLPICGTAQETVPPSLDQQVDSLNWHRSPEVCRMLAVGVISPAGDLRCLGSSDTRRFLEINGNPPADNNYTLAPTTLSWFAIFGFDPSGYVPDNEQLDPDLLLKSLKASNIAAQAERRQLHLPALTLLNWYVPPHYNIQTKQLEWGTRLQSDTKEEVLNYTVRILGRSGVTSVTLVSDPTTFESDLRSFRQALQAFEYLPGERYEEFRQGDRVAEYGLSALVVGGAAAVATKSGFGKVFIAILAGGAKALFAAVVACFVAVGALIKNVIQRVAKKKVS